MTITINKCFEVLSVVLIVAALVLSNAATAAAEDVHKTHQQNPVLSRFHEWLGVNGIDASNTTWLPGPSTTAPPSSSNRHQYVRYRLVATREQGVAVEGNKAVLLRVPLHLAMTRRSAEATPVLGPLLRAMPRKARRKFTSQMFVAAQLLYSVFYASTSDLDRAPQGAGSTTPHLGWRSYLDLLPENLPLWHPAAGLQPGHVEGRARAALCYSCAALHAATIAHRYRNAHALLRRHVFLARPSVFGEAGGNEALWRDQVHWALAVAEAWAIQVPTGTSSQEPRLRYVLVPGVDVAAHNALLVSAEDTSGGARITVQLNKAARVLEVGPVGELHKGQALHWAPHAPDGALHPVCNTELLLTRALAVQGGLDCVHWTVDVLRHHAGKAVKDTHMAVTLIRGQPLPARLLEVLRFNFLALHSESEDEVREALARLEAGDLHGPLLSATQERKAMQPLVAMLRDITSTSRARLEAAVRLWEEEDAGEEVALGSVEVDSAGVTTLAGAGLYAQHPWRQAAMEVHRGEQRAAKWALQQLAQ